MIKRIDMKSFFYLFWITTFVGNAQAYCAAGKYSLDGVTGCTDCAMGKYQNLGAQSACKSCPAGWYQELAGRVKAANPTPHVPPSRVRVVAQGICPGSEEER